MLLNYYIKCGVDFSMTLSDRAKEFCLAEKHVMSLLKFFEWPIDNTALANNIFVQVLNTDFISFQNLSHIYIRTSQSE